MKEIELSNGMKTMVDDEDYTFLSFFRWNAINVNGHYYVRTAKKIKNRLYSASMHGMLCSCPEGKEIDHIDRNPLNNQKSNLRAVTHKENMQNRNIPPKKTICNLCGINKRRKNSCYCAECSNKYQRLRRLHNPILRAKETERKREYRSRIKTAKLAHEPIIYL
jgi:hypothetical protein